MRPVRTPRSPWAAVPVPLCLLARLSPGLKEQVSSLSELCLAGPRGPPATPPLAQPFSHSFIERLPCARPWGESS